jgi:hypothetical protein
MAKRLRTPPIRSGNMTHRVRREDVEQVGARSDATRRHAPGRALASVAAGLAILTDIAYIAIILAQKEAALARVTAVASCILAAGVAAGVASRADLHPAIRLPVLSGAAGGLLSLGVLGLFSIGLPLFVGGVLAVIAWARAARSPGGIAQGTPTRSMLALLLGLALPVAAVALT